MIEAVRLRRWQSLTVGLMVVGYAGYYLCRSNLSVMLLSIAEEQTSRGLTTSVADAKERLGWAVTLGTFGYAIGKFAAGSFVDLLGGRRNYLIGMAGAIVCTMLFAMGGSIPVLTLVWFANRLIQSLGWPGMIKMTSRWFSYARYGTVMGVISLSFLFGDALARAFMGQLIQAGFGWRAMFWVAAGTGIKSKKDVWAMMIFDEIMRLFAERGTTAYHGEAVSQAEHALQAAALAVQEGASDDLIVAALLHDVGHLLDGQDEDLATRGLDGRHEEAGCAWLARHFSPSVTEPIRLHVAAKRYLCAVEPGYLASLSPASRLSLAVQGGSMTAEEVANSCVFAIRPETRPETTHRSGR